MIRLKLGVIVPTRNSATGVYEAVKKLLVLGPVIVADSRSQDGTAENARKAGAIVVNAPLGKWSAILTAVRKHRLDAYLMIDVDLPVDVADLIKVADKLRRNDLVLIRRSPDLRPLPDRVLTILFHLLARIFGVKYRDVQAGVKGFRRSLILNASQYLPTGFLGDLVLTCYALKRGYRVVEVPVRWADSRRNWRTRIILLLKIALELIRCLPTLIRRNRFSPLEQSY